MADKAMAAAAAYGFGDWRDAAEAELRAVMGRPPAGTTWMDEIRRENADAPPLTGQQREHLALLLAPERGAT